MPEADERLEIEMKFPVSDLAAVEQKLSARGARPGPVLQEADHYFNAPDRDFARTDEALRLRRVGQVSFLTYKGPKRDAQTKTRAEVEVPLAEGDQPAEDFLRLVQYLGYRPVAVVRKKRKTYHLQAGGFDVEACLDDVEGVGSFAELEIIASARELEPAKAILLRLADELGMRVSERRSYLEMLQSKQ